MPRHETGFWLWHQAIGHDARGRQPSDMIECLFPSIVFSA